MLLRMIPIALVIVVASICLSGTNLATAEPVVVPRSAFHQYTHLAVRLARLKSWNRTPALYLLGLRRVVWPQRWANQVVITIDVTDSTCRRWPRNPRNFHCRPRFNSRQYSCKGKALVRNGLRFVRFLWTKCWRRGFCRKRNYFGYSF
ncbi:hypothetical protein MTO96_042065 [Rhipicephalus appendiculatus]|uniref:Uncharacterized protein n=1 Tax=Rhipicephalus appendiculatus TaxID=34631 RepID=A0A131YDI2_RHIAP